MAQIEGGAQIGFSTYGYSEGRKPTAADRAKYRLTEQQVADGAVVIQDWDLIKIDAVDNPAVSSAWLCRDVAAFDVLNMLTTPPAAITEHFDMAKFAENF